ncbi:MAG: hypothetical protein JW727_03905 [Candidatus Aenigmarchaeota archaeon]|nr:hypothetical protein [Candidatus Aenigmarchaeota archaeon]
MERIARVSPITGTTSIKGRPGMRVYTKDGPYFTLYPSHKYAGVGLMAMNNPPIENTYDNSMLSPRQVEFELQLIGDSGWRLHRTDVADKRYRGTVLFAPDASVAALWHGLNALEGYEIHKGSFDLHLPIGKRDIFIRYIASSV